MRLGSLALASLFLGALTAAAAGPHSPVVWHVKNAPAKALKTGGKFDITLNGQIEDGWHLYALEEPEDGPIATTVNLTEGDPAEVQRVTESKPKLVLDAAFGKQTGLFEGSAEFTLHGQLAHDATPGPHTLHVLVRFQSCSGSLCLPPHVDSIDVPVTVSK